MDKAAIRASKGGHARAAALTPEERSESASKAVAARWAKAKAITPVVSMSVSQANAFGNERMQIDISLTNHVEPLIQQEVKTWTVNSLSYVITQDKSESSTH